MSVKIGSQEGWLSKEKREEWSRESRRVIQECLLPDLDMLLPKMGFGGAGEVVFVVVFADDIGATALAKRIREQLDHREHLKQAGLTFSVSYKLLSPPLTDVAAPLGDTVEKMAARIFSALKDTGLDPSSLELELTESVLMNRAESTESILKALRAIGVKVAVDDFGTGYSSLSYLRKFPIDALKIDQSFVHQITTVPDETIIVAAVISMGRSLKLRVIAEGVETQDELAFLQTQQCDEAQGYYFSPPVVPEQFAKLLETGIPETVLH